ncbi:MAG: carbohydrate-binding domain-containing protein [Eubacteriales bacterium]|nr:carbohydrate-binding domain-containing protein [Eubacteriales bacterium]
MKLRKAAIILVCLILMFSFASCSLNPDNGDNGFTESIQAEESNVSSEGTSDTSSETPGSSPTQVEYKSKDTNSEYDENECTIITLSDNATAITGTGAEISGNTVTITKSGYYVLRGTLTDGQIIVNCESGTVRLVLDGASVSCSHSAPLYDINGDIVLILAEGSENSFSDAASYVFEEGADEPSACIYAKDDIAINGSGKLTVTGNYNNGIQSKDTLKITGGSVNVTAVNNGLKGKDYVAVSDGIINVNAAGDGIKSDNETDEGMGIIQLDGGAITVTAGDDGVQAYGNIILNGGSLSITAAGGDIYAYGTSVTIKSSGAFSKTSTVSQKGMKAVNGIYVTGGEYNITTNDDAVHSDNKIYINGGNFTITAGSDGIYAADTLTIDDGTFNIFTGEGSAAAPVRSGKSNNGGGFTRSDRQNNGSSGTTTGSVSGEIADSCKAIKSGSSLKISGGTFVIDAYDDAVHSDGSVTISGGNFSIKSGDDGIHGNDNVTISGGIITIEKSYEGVESSTIDISGGVIDITASDDGINASDGTGAGTVGSPGKGNSALYIRISGGEIVINASADGIDSNGNMFLDGGYIYVVGSSDPESAIDADGTITVSGGTVVGIGSTGHMEAPTASSTQPTLMIIFSSEQASGTMIKLTDEKGNVIFEGTSEKAFQSYFFTDPALVKGKSYTLYADGKEKATITLTTAITICSETGGTVSSNGGTGGGGPGGGPGRR